MQGPSFRAERSAVEESRDASLKLTHRDPSTSLGMTVGAAPLSLHCQDFMLAFLRLTKTGSQSHGPA